MKSINDVNIQPGTRAFVRGDLDVPIENGQILEKYRLDATLPTLKLLKEKQTKIIIAGHIKRPKGVIDEKLSTKQLIPYFNENLGEGNFELLENLRFDIREEQNDESYAKELAAKADIYVNESFSTSHENHASVVGIPKLIPGYAGLRLELEVLTIKKILKDAARPLIAIVGGAKLESKKPAVLKLLKIADLVLVGGRIGNNWNSALPANMRIPKDYAEFGKDIGKRTIEEYEQLIQTAKTIVWVGPLGAYEEEKFAQGTNIIAKAVVDSGAFSLAGGGDTVAALNNAGMLGKFSFISTGGSAMLEFICNETLVGLKVLGYEN